jgi:hypothetical protein
VAPQKKLANQEKRRLEEDRVGSEPWKKWGPYLSERQWGTVREDYSPHGDAWDYLPHDHARSRAYRWGEDGLAGVSDDEQRLCLALALWNGRDPILKERLFGLTNEEGNHGEDVKELYYYLDATPTNSYLKMLYKYPQRAFPYAELVEENRRRGRDRPEYELLDTGVFDDDRYFDVFVEYAKAGPDDLLLEITVHNRGPDAAPLDLLPQIWFRNTWSWQPGADRPALAAAGDRLVVARHPQLGAHWAHGEATHPEAAGDIQPALLFCDNETNVPRLFGSDGASGYYKDAFHEYVVHGRRDAVNPNRTGTKAAFHYRLMVPAHGTTRVRVRLTNDAATEPFAQFDDLIARRRREADEFYAELQANMRDADARSVQRQALAGMIWGKQYYDYSVWEWLHGDPGQPRPPSEHRLGRNRDWEHLRNGDILSMPDKWEYPWYAAWDLAFHCIPLALIDPEFAKAQLVLLTREHYMHPNGQLPAYEWSLGDVNPPVHAWATWRVYQIDRNHQRAEGRKSPKECGDLAFLERVFHKLLLNFTWWINRKDTQGRNIFQGGFLGLDNIGPFDRSEPLTGGRLDQADGTAWMAMYSLNLMRIALELALYNPTYEDMATKFFEHFLEIAKAMTHTGSGPGHTGNAKVGLWDEQDEFYYDQWHLPDGRTLRLKVRSMVGLIPLFAVETLEPELLERLPQFGRRLEWFLGNRPDLAGLVSRWQEPGRGERRLLSLLRGHRMKRLLRRMLDESEFLSDYGVRALSKHHHEHPYTITCHGTGLTVGYEPGESESGLFGGNSNWRGPVWFPVNFLIIESLQKFHHYYGDDFNVECPTASGQFFTIGQIAEELSRRLTRIFLKDESGHRPVLAYHEKLHGDPHFRDYVLFHEYFHADTGRGVGAAHQTGWTGLVAKLLQPRRPKAHEPGGRPAKQAEGAKGPARRG